MNGIKYYLFLLLIGILMHSNALANEDKIASAMSAGPDSVSAQATVMDWDNTILRKGSNSWTCLPDRPDTKAIDPWCIDEHWLNFLNAYMKKEKPTYTGVGIAYMLKGDAPVSNTDPFATEPTGKENDWVTGVGGHLMILVPDHDLLKGISTDHKNGGPWIMWPDTPYVHIMIPVESR
ncbi:MAG: hypothetical protein Kow0089_18380 [Desulfobulbaceae bacterium]